MASRTLLIVDDDQHVRERLRNELQATHWTVVEASSGMEAVPLAKQHAPDLILLDVALEGMSTDTVAKMLKLDAVTCAIPIVVLSAVLPLEGPLQPWAADTVQSTVLLPALLAKLEHVLAKQKRRRPYVLVVDDEPDLVEILTALLIERGFAASGASNGAEALEVVRSVQPDAILLDLDMPLINGWKFLSCLKGSIGLDDVRVVILTGKDRSAEDREHGLKLGVADYLLKPCAPDDIIRALQLALNTSPSGNA